VEQQELRRVAVTVQPRDALLAVGVDQGDQRSAASISRRSAAAISTRLPSLVFSTSGSGGSSAKSNAASSAGIGRWRSSSNFTMSCVEPATAGRSIGFTVTVERARPIATVRAGSERASSSARSAAPGFSASTEKVSTRSRWIAATPSRSPSITTASRSGENLGTANFIKVG
jgi:hypothetical protein